LSRDKRILVTKKSVFRQVAPMMPQQDAEKLFDRASSCAGMSGGPEPGWSVRQLCIVVRLANMNAYSNRGSRWNCSLTTMSWGN